MIALLRAAIALATAAGYLAVLVAVDGNARDKGARRSLRASVIAGGVASFGVLPVAAILWVIEDPAIELTSPLLVNVLFTGQVEELAKFIAFVVVMRRHGAFKEPLDAATHAAAVGLGFSVLENVSYGIDHGMWLQLARAFLCTPGHMVYCAICGVYYAGVRTRQWKGRIWRSPLTVFLVLIPSASLHGLYNYILDAGFLGAGFAVEFVTVALAACLVRMLRTSSPYRIAPLSEPAWRIETSIRILRRALVDHSSSFLLHRRLAEAHLRLRRYAPAIAHLDACLVTDPANPEIRALKGCALIARGRTAEGTAQLESAAQAAGYSGRRRVEGVILRALDMRTPATTPRGELSTRYLIKSTLETADLVPRAGGA